MKKNLGMNSYHFLTYGTKKHGKKNKPVEEGIYLDNADPAIIRRFKAKQEADAL